MLLLEMATIWIMIVIYKDYDCNLHESSSMMPKSISGFRPTSCSFEI